MATQFERNQVILFVIACPASHPLGAQLLNLEFGRVSRWRPDSFGPASRTDRRADVLLCHVRVDRTWRQLNFRECDGRYKQRRCGYQ